MHSLDSSIHKGKQNVRKQELWYRMHVTPEACVSANKRINNFTRVTFNFGTTTLLRLTQFSELGECRGILWLYCTGHAYREKQEKKNEHCTMIPNCLITSRARSSTHATSDVNTE